MSTTVLERPNPVQRDVHTDLAHFRVPPAWLLVWRDGIAPQFSTEALRSLGNALRRDDPALLQGATTSPPPLPQCEQWPCEAADPLAWASWQGGRGPARTVGEVETAFALLCHESDRLLNEPASIRYFTSFWDDQPRALVVPALLAEVERSLELREGW